MIVIVQESVGDGNTGTKETQSTRGDPAVTAPGDTSTWIVTARDVMENVKAALTQSAEAIPQSTIVSVHTPVPQPEGPAHTLVI